jgi:hypothetical protein
MFVDSANDRRGVDGLRVRMRIDSGLLASMMMAGYRQGARHLGYSAED